jgi:type III secretory pathway component EscU
MDDADILKKAKALYLKAIAHQPVKIAIGVLLALIAYSLLGWIWVALAVAIVAYVVNHLLSEYGGIVGVAKKLKDEVEKS